MLIQIISLTKRGSITVPKLIPNPFDLRIILASDQDYHKSGINLPTQSYHILYPAVHVLILTKCKSEIEDKLWKCSFVCWHFYIIINPFSVNRYDKHVVEYHRSVAVYII